jgi:diaminohydroxyphosphoribosylaminopyrimidine deaminase/5-amino-6-(5-phosphoribosylamino)uracil reductase
MQRCLELAKKGAGKVAPNPMVGALLVQNNKIIAEGWHEYFGGPHAEVNCIGRGAPGDLNDTTLYVSLEPCSHFGKTPPCTDLIIKHKIPKVIIGCRDPFKEVDGKGIEKLKAAGIEVEVGILENECKELNKRFFIFHTHHRPYVILKWAETGDGFIAPPPPEGEASPNPRPTGSSGRASEGGALESSISVKSFGFSETRNPPSGGRGAGSRLFITNEYSNRLVHQWRSEESSILVGTNTALQDDPELTTRLWPGDSPVRLVIDMELKLPHSLHLFDKQVKTIVFNKIKHEENENLVFYQVTEEVGLVHQMMNALYQMNIQSVIVEGGARLLQSFIDEGIWDEARVLVNGELAIGNGQSAKGRGLSAPVLTDPIFISGQHLLKDRVYYYKRAEANS